MCKVTLNNELKGIELSFATKPEESILSAIKSNGFRWHNVKKVWYAKQNEKTLTFADSLKELETITAPKTPQQQSTTATVKTPIKKEVKTFSLWNATRWIEEASNVDKNLSCKEIAAITRKHLKEQFPVCKFSITSDYDHVRIEIVSSLYDRHSTYLEAIYNYCSKYIDSYVYCTCYDPYGDYGSSHNFYARVSYSYDYIQTEQTESITSDISNFDKQQELFIIAEEERKEVEFQEYLKKQEEQNKVYNEREALENSYLVEVEEKAIVKELTEDQTYFVKNIEYLYTESLNIENGLSFSHDGTIEDIEVNKEIHFSDIELYNKFLTVYKSLHDISFISQTGGSRTEDNRINSMTDYDNMTREEKETVLFFNIGVAIYLNDKLMFVIDAQGHSYGKYTALLTEESEVLNKDKYNNIIVNAQQLTSEQIDEYKTQAETLEDLSFTIINDNSLTDTWNNESWTLYKDLIKEALKHCSFKLNSRVIQQLPEQSINLKLAMYKLLKEVDGIQEQFKEADLQQGQKVTIFTLGCMGGVSTSHITVDKVENSEYAQYKNAVKITFKQPKKHGLYYNHYYSDMLVYDGWIELPQNVLYDVSERNGMTITSGKFSSCDKKAYDAVIEYLAKQNQLPIVNTYKPIF